MNKANSLGILILLPSFFFFCGQITNLRFSLRAARWRNVRLSGMTFTIISTAALVQGGETL